MAGIVRGRNRHQESSLMIDALLLVWFVAGMLSLAALGIVAGMWLFCADWREQIKEDWKKCNKTRYKLTDQNRRTHGGFQLPADGEWFAAARCDAPAEPCTDTVLHHYAHPLLAILFNPIHADLLAPRLFEIEIDDEIGTDGLKGWARRQRIIQELPLPELTREQRIAFAIYCAEPYAGPGWLKWATAWMDGSDRSEESAAAAAAAARAAEAAAARAAARAAEAAGHPDFLAIIQRVLRDEVQG